MQLHLVCVAPLVGAWIETRFLQWSPLVFRSHPSWVRGLKQRVGKGDLQAAVSHPSWVRGLKLIALAAIAMANKVAPLVGAWIETWMGGKHHLSILSHPSWVRGLKPTYHQPKAYPLVAPLVGAWIETEKKRSAHYSEEVAPLVGAWIETWAIFKESASSFCRTPRGCVD